MLVLGVVLIVLGLFIVWLGVATALGIDPVGWFSKDDS